MLNNLEIRCVKIKRLIDDTFHDDTSASVSGGSSRSLRVIRENLIRFRLRDNACPRCLFFSIKRWQMKTFLRKKGQEERKREKRGRWGRSDKKKSYEFVEKSKSD